MAAEVSGKAKSTKKQNTNSKSAGAKKTSSSGKKRTKKVPEKELTFSGMRSRVTPEPEFHQKASSQTSDHPRKTKSKTKGKGIRARKLHRKQLRMLAALIWGAAVVLSLISRLSVGFSDWYAEKIYSVFVGSLGRFFSLFPVSMAELGLYAGMLWILYRAVLGIRLVIGKKRKLREIGITWLHTAALITGVLFLIFTLLGGINYQRKSFVDTIGLTVEASTREELVEFLTAAAEQVNEAASQMQTDEAGKCQVSGDLRKQAVTAMEGLGEEFESLSGYYPKPKPVWITDILSYQKVTGIYSPFTAEANYNRAIPDYDLPHTLCHELAHLKGFMREEEANFISWLACTGSDVPEFRYSGWLIAFIYAGNDLARYDSAAYQEIRSSLCESAKLDLSGGTEFWKQFDGPVAETHQKVNDIYLKANSQTDGVESYGRVVELMLAYLRHTCHTGKKMV